MQKKAQALLEQFGFTKVQAALFYAGFIGDPMVMAQLARAANVPRTSALYVMPELVRRGFFKQQRKGVRTYYRAASGEELIATVHERERLVRQFLKLC